MRHRQTGDHGGHRKRFGYCSADESKRAIQRKIARRQRQQSIRQQDLQPNDEEHLEARAHHSAGAEGHQSVGRRVLHLRHTVDALFRPESPARRVRLVRKGNTPSDIRHSPLAGLRQLHGQSHILHNFQQSLSPGLQEGATL